ncbi:MAG: beta-ketoacyl-[acyl-carrier-protein] synthase II [Puniceicoccaceae bacterium]|nr:MAG: beta-ketoacyl-[acyl-carrier-protein] synthase II [Puniceicoccaceae bacterium]
MASNPSQTRVAVTGLGVVTSLGIGIDPFWDALLAGRSGIDRVTAFDTAEFTSKIGGEVREFDATAWMDPKEVRRNDRYTHLAVAASRLAVEDSGLELATENPEQVGVYIGSGIGGMYTIESQARVLFERGPRKISPFMIPSLIANMASGIVAIDLGARGPNYSIVSACATAAHCIGEALKTIRTGEAKVMIAGGSEAAITALGYAGFCSMKAMSTRNDEPTRASRPFDRGRDGFVMGEGAGILILEDLEHARARGARIYCELSGYAASCDAYHITQPDPEGRGLSLAMGRALADAGCRPEEIGYLNAHGTSTPYNDKFETLAVKSVFGDHARRLMMSSTKSMTGHLLGAAGGIESAACAKVIAEGAVPPTINYEEPDPDCDLDYVPNEARQAKVRAVLTNNLGFGGQNASLVFRAID